MKSKQDNAKAMEILQTFGLQWGPFISQIVIILVVFAILNKYAFGPVTAMLEERRTRIAEGEANLEKIRIDLGQAEENVQNMLDEANTRAERLITDARDSAEAVREQKTQDAITEAQKIIEKSREASKLEHDRMITDLKRDFGRLVIDTTSKVSGKVLNSKDQERINEETAGQIAL